MPPTRNCHIGLAVLIAILFGHFQAAPASGSEQELNGRREFITKGKVNIQLISGPLFSATIFDDGTPTTHSWQNAIRLGLILNNPPQKEYLLRGNFEAMIEASHALIYRGPGSYWAGIAALLRYNFVQPDSRLIPYVQAGAGIVYNNAYKDYSQDAIGQEIEFTPQASLGLRYFLKKRWSIDFEGIFLHISNADLAERNAGLNFLGGFIGISYLYDR